MNHNAEAARVQLHHRGLGCPSVYTLHISLYVTVFLSRVFFSKSWTNKKGQPVHFLSKQHHSALQGMREYKDVWYPVFHCRVKFPRLPVVSPMRLVFRHNRARRPAEKAVCVLALKTPPCGLQTPRRRRADRGRSDSVPSRAERPP